MPPRETFRIRLGTPADRDAVATRFHALWQDTSLEAHTREVSAILAGRPPSTMPLVIFVAEAEGAVVGFVEAHLRSAVDGCDGRRPVGFIEGWFVDEGWRRKGLGAALVRAAETWARALGCTEMGSDTWSGNEVSEKAHLALGYEVVDRCVNFRRTLPVEPSCALPGGESAASARAVDKDRRISKLLSFVLRHRPEHAGVTLDRAGFTPVDALLRGLATLGEHVSAEDLRRVVATNPKRRFELSEDVARIRASQGHSVEVDLGYPPSVPPGVLYHGTATRNVASIREHGLLRRRRHHVHLSTTREAALEVGRRHGAAVALEIDAGAMHAEGHVFHLSTNGVWLTERVPPIHIRPAGPRRVHAILYVADQARAAAFWRDVLQVEPRLDVPGMTEIEIAGAVLGLMPEQGIARLLGDRLPDPARARGVPRAEIYLLVDDPAACHARAIAAGATELSPLTLRDWGHEVAYTLDPDGHVVAFAREGGAPA